jgi:hypothetical protein
VVDPCAAIVHAVIGMQRVKIVVLRWPGTRAFNAAATFPSLALGSAAAQSLANLPITVSTLVCVHSDHASGPGPVGRERLLPVVGVHSDDRMLRDRAVRTLRHHGAGSLAVFAS